LARLWSFACRGPLPATSKPNGKPIDAKQLSWNLRPFNTFGHSRFGSLETSTPRHLPSSGFEYPLDGLLPAALGYGPSATAAFMGFSLQGLTPPDPRFPSRGLASLVVPRPRTNAEPARLQRFFRNQEGERRFKTPAIRKTGYRADSSNLAFLGVRPSRAFSSIALKLTSNFSPSCPSTENAPYGFHSRAGLQGFSVR